MFTRAHVAIAAQTLTDRGWAPQLINAPYCLPAA